MKIIEFADKPFSWLQWPVMLKGCKEPSLHITAKFFGRAKISAWAVEELTHDIPRPPLPASGFQWRPEIFGEMFHVLAFVVYPHYLKEVHSRFDLIADEFTPWVPHISVPIQYWEKVRLDWLSPKMEDITVGPLELCLGLGEDE